MGKTENETEAKTLGRLIGAEDLAEKKAKIYSRLLTETSLAKAMEALALRHCERKEKLMRLSGIKVPEKQNGGSMDETKEEEQSE